MGHDSAHGSAPVNDDEEEDSLIEEVSSVKPKKPSRRAARAKKNDLKEPPKEWIVEEEIALCQAWCDVSENNIVGNNMKTKGFGMRLLRTLKRKLVHQEAMTRSLANGKIGFALKLVLFALSSIMLKIITKVRMSLWKSHEVRSLGRDQSKAKKKSAASSREKSSSFVDLVADKFLNIKKEKRNKREEQQQSYIQLKNQELNIQEAERWEAAELKREKIAIQRRTLELAEREKRDRDILFYNTEINSSLPAIQQQKLQKMKDEIRERYNLDY
ncbi:hypothetical protein Tco_0667908 [Tanacetum coccineum]